MTYDSFHEELQWIAAIHDGQFTATYDGFTVIHDGFTKNYCESQVAWLRTYKR